MFAAGMKSPIVLIAPVVGSCESCALVTICRPCAAEMSGGRFVMTPIFKPIARTASSRRSVVGRNGTRCPRLVDFTKRVARIEENRFQRQTLSHDALQKWLL